MREAHQSPGEELANTVTHGIGAALATAALVVLVVFASLRGPNNSITLREASANPVVALRSEQ